MIARRDFLRWLAALPAAGTALMRLGRPAARAAEDRLVRAVGPIRSGAASGGVDPTNGIFIRKAGDAGNYIAICRSGGVESTIDLAFSAMDASNTHRFVITGGATNVQIFVDGVSKGNIAANVPTANLGPAGSSNSMAGAVGAAAAARPFSRLWGREMGGPVRAG